MSELDASATGSCMHMLTEKGEMDLSADATIGQSGLDEQVEGAKMVENTRCEWWNMLRSGGEFLSYDDLDEAISACFLHAERNSVFDNHCNRGVTADWRKGAASKSPFKLCKSKETGLSKSTLESKFASCSFVLTEK